MSIDDFVQFSSVDLIVSDFSLAQAIYINDIDNHLLMKNVTTDDIIEINEDVAKEFTMTEMITTNDHLVNQKDSQLEKIKKKNKTAQKKNKTTQKKDKTTQKTNETAQKKKKKKKKTKKKRKTATNKIKDKVKAIDSVENSAVVSKKLTIQNSSQEYDQKNIQIAIHKIKIMNSDTITHEIKASNFKIIKSQSSYRVSKKFTKFSAIEKLSKTFYEMTSKMLFLFSAERKANKKLMTAEFVIVEIQKFKKIRKSMFEQKQKYEHVIKDVSKENRFSDFKLLTLNKQKMIKTER